MSKSLGELKVEIHNLIGLCQSLGVNERSLEFARRALSSDRYFTVQGARLRLIDLVNVRKGGE